MQKKNPSLFIPHGRPVRLIQSSGENAGMPKNIDVGIGELAKAAKRTIIVHGVRPPDIQGAEDLRELASQLFADRLLLVCEQTDPTAWKRLIAFFQGNSDGVRSQFRVIPALTTVHLSRAETLGLRTQTGEVRNALFCCEGRAVFGSWHAPDHDPERAHDCNGLLDDLMRATHDHFPSLTLEEAARLRPATGDAAA